MIRISSKYKAVKRIKKLYGKKGVVRAVYNRLTLRPLEYKLTPIPLKKDEIGRMIFKQQQEELSKEQMIEEITSMISVPKISVIMPLYNPPLKWLQCAIDSLRNQVYTNWELCAVNDGSTEREGVEYLHELQKTENRIKILECEENKGISEASNQALKLAEGEYIALIDQDDEVTTDAFFWFVKIINQMKDVDLVYSDECKIDGKTGTKLSYFICKPDWSPEMMINQMYTGHLSMYKKEIVYKAGGFRDEYNFSQDYDLALRVSRMTNNIHHLERILYFWRSIPTSSAAGGKDYARESNINALKSHLLAQGINPEMKKLPYANYAYMKLKSLPLVSIIVPSDSCENMIRTIKGIIKHTEYENYEIILVTNSNAISEMKTRFENDKIVYCPFDKQYNFSAKCNEGARCAKGDMLVFYNDDVVPRNYDWLERILEIFEIEGVGGVSPMLIYENDMIQYAGMVSGVRNQVGTSFHLKKMDEVDYWFNQLLLRDVSVLSGACVAIKKKIFFEIEQFDAVYTPSAHSDVDLSYKLLDKGYRCVYTPYARMTHIGNHSWETKGTKDKSHIYCLKRWGKYISNDPFFTNSMKKLFYYPGNAYYYYIYSPEQQRYKENVDCKDILFITHELTRTGAPVQLMNMIKATYQKMNYFPVVVSPVDGPMRQEFLDMGITVIIDEELVISAYNLDSYARNYDLIVVNTMAGVCIEAIKELEDTLPPILWWIHEGNFAFNLFKKKLPKGLNSQIHLYCASEYSQRMLNKFSKSYKSEIIRCGIEDLSQNNYLKEDVENNKILFLTVGTLEWRKGQDLLLDAVKALEPSIREKAIFYIIGKSDDEDLMNKIQEYENKYHCIKYMDVMPREQLMRLYCQSTAAIIPSRDEPTSLIGIESMMFSKAVITSDMTGISEFITDKEDGFIFESDNIDDLKSSITYVITHLEEVKMVGKNSRKIYEKYYKMDIFSKRCEEVLSSLLD